VSHRVIIYEGLRSISQNEEFRQECTHDELRLLDHCLTPPEPNNEQMHRALRIVGRKYACGD
jgi:hypothetical protein